jgi:two-component system LytT family response regulator
MYILIAEDESRSAQLLNQLVRSFWSGPLEIATVGSVNETISATQVRHPYLLLLDIELGGHSGFDALEKIQHRQFPFVVISASKEYAFQTYQLGGSGYVLKPVSKEDLYAVLRRLPVFKGQAIEI